MNINEKINEIINVQLMIINVQNPSAKRALMFINVSFLSIKSHTSATYARISATYSLF